MKQVNYDKIVKKNLPDENKLTNALIAFSVGGLIGAFGNFLIEIYSTRSNISSSLLFWINLSISSLVISLPIA